MNGSSHSSLKQRTGNEDKCEVSPIHHFEDGKAWYLVHCKPNCEQVALRNLENQHFSVFLPLQNVTNRRGTVFKKQLKPLFPGYIFVAQNSSLGQWHKINNTRGVARLVCFGAEPSPVPSTIMHQLFDFCDSTSVFKQTSSLLEGNEVKITQGSLTGSIAKIIKIEPNMRVHLLFHFMGQASTLKLHAETLAPVS